MKSSSPNFLNDNPAQYFLLILLAACAIWHLFVLIISMILLIVVRYYNMDWRALLCAGLLAVCISIAVDILWLKHSKSLFEFFIIGYNNNIIFLKLLCRNQLPLACYFEYRHSMSYLISMPLLMAGIFSMISSFQVSPHNKTLRNLKKGRLPSQKEKNNTLVLRKLNLLKDKNFDGTLLGIETRLMSPVIVPDYYVNQMVLVLGTTGAGKTITLRRFAQRAITKGHALIFVDGKPTDDNVQFIMNLAEENHTKFYGFNCGNFDHYDVLSSGGYTELKDKIITLKDQWENDYYRSIAEDYLQTTLEVLLKLGKDYNLKTIAKCLDYKHLTAIARKLDDPILADRVESLQHYLREALTGLQAHLNVLIHSELGEYLTLNDKSYNLRSVIEEGSIVYFALPALKYSAFAKVLGKLVVNDLKAIIESSHAEVKVFTLFDEFSVFAGEQVLNLVNMGRGKGIHAIFGTQGLADLSKISPDFESQLTNCVNTIICHRLNDQKSAEAVSYWIGTEDAFDITAQVSDKMQGFQSGSIRTNKAFSVHPDEIKKGLSTGEAFFVSKVKAFELKKVLVKCESPQVT